MTDDMTLLKSSRRVRAQSERELRLLRLAWLAGWRTADIAALIGESVRTVNRRLRRHELRGPEAPGEKAGLIARAMKDAIVEGMLCGETPAVKEFVSMLQKMAGATRTLQHAAREQKADEVSASAEDPGDWRREALEELERLVAADAGVPEEDARGDAVEPAHETKSRVSFARPDAGILRPSLPPVYSGSAAGPGADVTAFGRTYRPGRGSREPPG